MAITHFMLQSNFNPNNPMLQHNFPLRSCIALKRNYSSFCIKTFSKFNVKCFIRVEGPKDFGENRGRYLKKVIWRTTENVMKALQVSVIAGVLLFLYDHHQPPLALAASASSSSSDDEVYTTTQISSSVSSSSAIDRIDRALCYAEMVFSLTLITFPLVLYSYSKIQELILDRKSVLKLQVGLLSTHRSLQKDLKRIAAASTSKGLSYVLQEATLALLRHPDYCISGYSSVDVKRSEFECEKLFNRFAIEERSNFDVVRKKSETSQSSNNEYIVVTIIVFVDGVSELPPIKSSAQLKDALQNVASIPSGYIKKVKMYWNPQQEHEFLTAQELLEDYPLLHPI